MRAGEEVEGREENKQGEGEDDGEEVVAELVPKEVKVCMGEVSASDEDERSQKEIHSMSDEVVVAKLHMLEIDRLVEVWCLVRHLGFGRRGKRWGVKESWEGCDVLMEVQHELFYFFSGFLEEEDEHRKPFYEHSKLFPALVRDK